MEYITETEFEKSIGIILRRYAKLFTRLKEERLAAKLRKEGK